MHRYTKLLLASLTATAILAMAISSASANRLSVSNNRLWRVTWTSLRFLNNVNTNTVLCPVTLEGSFHSATIVKTIGALLGYVTRASLINNCTGGHATIRTETLPWHIRYRGYSGTLPNITLIILGLSRTRFRVETGGITCEVTTEDTNPAVGRLVIRNGVVENLTPDPRTTIPLEGLCGFGGRGSFEEASQTLTEVPGGSRLTVTLI